MRLSIVLSTQQTAFQAATFSGELDLNLKKIADLGYQGVEFTIRDPRLVDADDLYRLVQKYGLVVPAIGTGQAWGEEGLSFTDPHPQVRRAAVERLKSHIPVAARLGAVVIIGLMRGTVIPGVERHQAEEWMLDALRECCQTAASSGVHLVLEPINRFETTLINTAEQGLEVLDQVGAANLGLLLDTFHMNIEEPDILASIQKCAGRIDHFHVADSNRWYPGAGHLDFAAILRALSSTGYGGFVSGEFMPKPDVDTVARANMEHLGPILRELG